jgi:hypothetical protein
MNRLMPLDFLVKLDRGQLPVTVTSNRELRCVSRLKATGLIEASLAVSGAPDRSSRRIDAALVFAITEAGIAEIRSVKGREERVPENFMQRNILALEYLRLLENSELPLSVTDQRITDCVEVLSNAGLVVADFSRGEADHPACAVVQRITEVGRDFLSRKYGKTNDRPRRRNPHLVKNWIERLA